MIMNKKLNDHHVFDGRTLLIATMHAKERVIAPLMEKELGVQCVTASMDTDVYGTFSGEIERKNDPLQTVRTKALAALELYDADLVMASEGSFGPHPSYFFVPANEELVILIDLKNHFEIVGRHLTVNTNFNKQEIKSLKDLEEFKTLMGYPSHGIILKIEDINNQSETIYKENNSPKALEKKVKIALEKNCKILAETDMRAMHNPTRMEAIKLATVNLIENIKSVCPNCNTPGFVIDKIIPGLPCELCRFPAKSAKAYVYRCKKCDFSHEKINEEIRFEDPTYCDFCNP